MKDDNVMFYVKYIFTNTNMQAYIEDGNSDNQEDKKRRISSKM